MTVLVEVVDIDPLGIVTLRCSNLTSPGEEEVVQQADDGAGRQMVVHSISESQGTPPLFTIRLDSALQFVSGDIHKRSKSMEAIKMKRVNPADKIYIGRIYGFLLIFITIAPLNELYSSYPYTLTFLHSLIHSLNGHWCFSFLRYRKIY